jgi:hypothetical protein
MTNRFAQAYCIQTAQTATFSAPKGMFLNNSLNSFPQVSLSSRCKLFITVTRNRLQPCNVNGFAPPITILLLSRRRPSVLLPPCCCLVFRLGLMTSSSECVRYAAGTPLLPALFQRVFIIYLYILSLGPIFVGNLPSGRKSEN